MTSLLIGTLVGVLALVACDRQGPMPTAPYPPPVASLDNTEESTTEPPETDGAEAEAETETDTETETTATRAKPLTRPNSPDRPTTSPDELTTPTPPNTAPTPAGGPTEN